MISNNIAQIAHLNAVQHDITRVFFAGGFLQRNSLIWHTLSYGLHYWSGGEMTARFLLHDGYLGAVGAFVESSHQQQ